MWKFSWLPKNNAARGGQRCLPHNLDLSLWGFSVIVHDRVDAIVAELGGRVGEELETAGPSARVARRLLVPAPRRDGQHKLAEGTLWRRF